MSALLDPLDRDPGPWHLEPMPPKRYVSKDRAKLEAVFESFKREGYSLTRLLEVLEEEQSEHQRHR